MFVIGIQGEKMTKLLSATYDHGVFRLKKPIKLRNRQRVVLAVAIDDEISSLLISKSAEKSQSFRFLKNPRENIYTLNDGEKV